MRKFKVAVNGNSYNVEVQEDEMVVSEVSPVLVKPVSSVAKVESAKKDGDNSVKAPMPGKIMKIVAKVGDSVKKGDVVLILEAMKMQNEIAAPFGGIIKAINVTKGQSVKNGQIMFSIG